MRLVAVLAVAPLAGGCNLIPPEGPSKLAQRPPIASGPSAQRLGPDGYPQLGAFPRSATTQLDDATVTAERGSLKAAASSQNVAAGSAAAQYQRSVADAKLVQAQTRRDVEAAVAVQRGGNEPAADGEDVLRAIEGR